MKHKETKNKRTYKAVSLSDSLKNINDQFSFKFGKLEYTIFSNWKKIVGSYFQEHSEPKKIVSKYPLLLRI